MDSVHKVESGLQLLSRLIDRPSVKNVYDILFTVDGPTANEVVEITGDTNTGKTVLITEIVAKSILPSENGGKDIGVILLNTDHNFQLFKLITFMENVIKTNKTDYDAMSQASVEDVIKKSLKNLIILNCYDPNQFLVTIYSLNKVLSANANVSLLILDSISAYYWCDKIDSTMTRMDTYWKNILHKIQVATREFKTVIIYTRPSYFYSKGNSTHKVELFENCVADLKFEHVNYRIVLEENKPNAATNDMEDDIRNTSFTARIQNAHMDSVKMYYISETGFVWLA